ncbi:MAG: hypothetical protein F2672_03195 [Actinobacteria bacterium]|uniref:Unannotated protein n=1 Tax=freshwater metagenome TaxID=449393 RepID=A0A6J6PPT0_9ZZZZ|nr:hypothetical protein [Actinomycetota bacterium]
MRAHKSSRIYLVRHGHSTANAKSILAGRDAKVSLSQIGILQADAVAKYFESIELEEIFSSPLPRCLETLKPLLTSKRNSKLVKLPGVIEMDYGKWSGKKLVNLSKLALWKTIQNRPSLVRFPNGESFLEMSDRAFTSVRESAIPGKNVLICSHGDVIKSIIASALGLNLDNFQRLSVDPASVSIIELSGDSSRLILANDTSHLPHVRQNLGSKKLRLGGGSGEGR